MSNIGEKHDKGKAPVFQGFFKQFPKAIEEISALSEFGARKYSWGDWKKVPDGRQRYLNAEMRHRLEIEFGNEFDNESLFPHEVHACWNALAALELYLIENEKKTLDYLKKTEEDDKEETIARGFAR